jgi:hypothetical protein
LENGILKGFEILRKTFYEGIKPIIEILDVLPWLPYTMVKLIINGYQILLFCEYSNENTLESVPSGNFPWCDTVIPFFGLPYER